jgi:hypothetical protein
VQVRLKWHVVTVPFEMTFLAVLNYHQQGLLLAVVKYLLTCFLSLLVGFYADRTARLDFLSTTDRIPAPMGPRRGLGSESLESTDAASSSGGAGLRLKAE